MQIDASIGMAIVMIEKELAKIKATLGQSSAELTVQAEIDDTKTVAGIIPLALMEKEAILRAMRVLNGDKLRVAKLLGIGKSSLYRKLAEYGVAA